MMPCTIMQSCTMIYTSSHGNMYTRHPWPLAGELHTYCTYMYTPYFGIAKGRATDAAWADARVNPHHPLKMFKVYTREIKKGQEACLG